MRKRDYEIDTVSSLLSLLKRFAEKEINYNSIRHIPQLLLIDSVVLSQICLRVRDNYVGNVFVVVVDSR